MHLIPRIIATLRTQVRRVPTNYSLIICLSTKQVECWIIAQRSPFLALISCDTCLHHESSPQRTKLPSQSANFAWRTFRGDDLVVEIIYDRARIYSTSCTVPLRSSNKARICYFWQSHASLIQSSSAEALALYVHSRGALVGPDNDNRTDKAQSQRLGSVGSWDPAT